MTLLCIVKADERASRSLNKYTFKYLFYSPIIAVCLCSSCTLDWKFLWWCELWNTEFYWLKMNYYTTPIQWKSAFLYSYNASPPRPGASHRRCDDVITRERQKQPFQAVLSARDRCLKFYFAHTMGRNSMLNVFIFHLSWKKLLKQLIISHLLRPKAAATSISISIYQWASLSMYKSDTIGR